MANLKRVCVVSWTVQSTTCIHSMKCCRRGSPDCDRCGNRNSGVCPKCGQTIRLHSGVVSKLLGRKVDPTDGSLPTGVAAACQVGTASIAECGCKVWWTDDDDYVFDSVSEAKQYVVSEVEREVGHRLNSQPYCYASDVSIAKACPNAVLVPSESDDYRNSSEVKARYPCCEYACLDKTANRAMGGKCPFALESLLASQEKGLSQ